MEKLKDGFKKETTVPLQLSISTFGTDVQQFPHNLLLTKT